MTARFLTATVALLFGAQSAHAQQTITLDGDVDPGEPDHVRVPFEVPDGVVEIEVAHDDLSEDNILDWGQDVTSPSRIRAEIFADAGTSAITSHVWVEPGSATPVGSEAEGDCGCRIPGAPSRRAPWLFAVLLLGPLVRRRKGNGRRSWTSSARRGTRNR